MDFGLSPDQIELRAAVRRMARGDLASGYLERAKSTEFPWEAYRQVARLGVLGLLAGPEHNPLDREDHLAAGLAVEELAYADFNLANAVIPVLLTSSLIARSGTDEMKERWLARLVAGQTYLAFGLTEPHSGSDAAALRTTATATAATTATATTTADGDGYLLTGEKTSVTMLAHAEAMLVTAQTKRDGTSLGVSAFLVDLSADGIATSDIPDTGWRPMGRGIVHFDEVRVPASARIGTEGAAFRSVLAGFDFTRPLLALTGIGCAQACVDETARYVADRDAFGAPLASFEGVSFPLAEHSTTLEAARLLCYAALWLRDEQRPHSAEASMSKWYGPLVASAAVKDCLLLHGHYGYAQEFGLEQRLRDVMAVEIADGTAQVQKIVVARERFGRAFVPYGKRPSQPQ
jgi:cyclohexanecarboxyl-CoA dehydrogenase